MLRSYTKRINGDLYVITEENGVEVARTPYGQVSKTTGKAPDPERICKICSKPLQAWQSKYHAECATKKKEAAKKIEAAVERCFECGAILHGEESFRCAPCAAVKKQNDALAKSKPPSKCVECGAQIQHGFTKCSKHVVPVSERAEQAPKDVRDLMHKLNLSQEQATRIVQLAREGKIDTLTSLAEEKPPQPAPGVRRLIDFEEE